MSLVSGAIRKLRSKLKDGGESVLVECIKDLIRPTILTIHAQYLGVESLGLKDPNKSDEEKANAMQGLYAAGTLIFDDEEVDEAILGDITLDSMIISSKPDLGIRSTNYRMYNREVVGELISSVEDFLSSTKDSDYIDLESVKTFNDLDKFFKYMRRKSNRAFMSTDFKGKAKSEITKISDEVLDLFDDYELAGHEFKLGMEKMITLVGQSIALQFKFVSTITKTIINIVTQGTTLSANTFTSTASPGYVKKEISQLSLEVRKMQADGEIIAGDIVLSIDRITAPIRPLLRISNVLTSPVGGIMIGVMFQNNAEKIAKVMMNIDKGLKITEAIRDNLLKIAATNLNTMGLILDIEDSLGIPQVDTNPNEQYKEHFEEGLVVVKDTIEKYKLNYYNPANDLMQFYTDLRKVVIGDTRYKYIRYDKVAYGKGETLKDRPYYINIELVKSPPLNYEKEDGSTYALKTTWIKECDSNIEWLKPYLMKYEKELARLQSDYDELVDELNNINQEIDVEIDIKLDDYEVFVK